MGRVGEAGGDAALESSPSKTGRTALKRLAPSSG
jgi:hypothetical protein